MNRSYGTRKLLYSLIPWTPIPRRGGGGGILGKIFSRGVICRHAVWVGLQQCTVRVLFRQVSLNAARYFSQSSIQNLINTYGAQQVATLQTRRGLEPKCVPQLFLGSRLNWLIRSIMTWYNSLSLWSWPPHSLSKRQSLSITRVLFRTTFTRPIILNLLLKWLLGSNLSQYQKSLWKLVPPSFRPSL